MKTTRLFFVFISLLFLFSAALNAQIRREIKQVAGREVKTEIWHKKEV